MIILGNQKPAGLTYLSATLAAYLWMHVVAVVDSEEVLEATQSRHISAVDKVSDNDVLIESRHLVLSGSGDAQLSTKPIANSDNGTSASTEQETQNSRRPESSASCSSENHSSVVASTTQRCVCV